MNDTQKVKLLTTILKEALGTASDVELEFVIQAEEMYPGISKEARLVADELFSSLQGWHYVEAIRERAIKDVENYLMHYEIHCLRNMLLALNNGRIELAGYDYSSPLSEKAQDLFVEYMRTRNRDIKDQFLKCVEEERFKM